MKKSVINLIWDHEDNFAYMSEVLSLLRESNSKHRQCVALWQLGSIPGRAEQNYLYISSSEYFLRFSFIKSTLLLPLAKQLSSCF